MAGPVAAETGAPRRSALGLRRPKHRLGIRIDMTPMVDVAFLLLIFFMVTTVFRRPLAMEVNMPEPGAKVEVPESNVLTVYVDSDDTMEYRVGTRELEPITPDGLNSVFQANERSNPDIIILVKIHRHARYERMVDMMDTLEDAGMQRFSVVPMTDDDLRYLEEHR